LCSFWCFVWLWWLLCFLPAPPTIEHLKPEQLQHKETHKNQSTNTTVGAATPALTLLRLQVTRNCFLLACRVAPLAPNTVETCPVFPFPSPAAPLGASRSFWEPRPNSLRPAPAFPNSRHGLCLKKPIPGIHLGAESFAMLGAGGLLHPARNTQAFQTPNRYFVKKNRDCARCQERVMMALLQPGVETRRAARF